MTTATISLVYDAVTMYMTQLAPLWRENKNGLTKQREKIERSIICANAKTGIAHHLADM